MLNMPLDLLLGAKLSIFGRRSGRNMAISGPASTRPPSTSPRNTVTSSDWQPSVFLNGDIAEKVAKIKKQEGPDLHVWGSGDLPANAYQARSGRYVLADDISGTLGDGKRLFAEGTIPAAFKVTESIVGSNGVILVNYRACRCDHNRSL